MTKRQGKKIDMFALIVLFFGKYDDVLKQYKPLSDQIALFLIKEKLLQSIRDDQGKGSKGKTMTKEMLLEAMVSLLMPLVETALAWAMVNNNKDMIALFSVSEDMFFVNFNDAVVLADNLIKGLEAHVAEMVDYDVTAAQIAAVKTAEAAFLAGKEMPKQQISMKKVATALLATEIKEADAILVICDLLMSGKYKKSAPEMLAEYKADRRIGQSVGRHTSIAASVYADEAHEHPIMGASMSIESLQRSAGTDVHGEVEIVQFKKGDYISLFKAKGFGDQEVPFSIQRGEHKEITVVMKANTLYGKVSKNGVGVAGYLLSIVDSNLSVVSDANGDFVLSEVPEGTGVLECSSESGDLIAHNYTMGNGRDLKLDFVF